MRLQTYYKSLRNTDNLSPTTVINASVTFVLKWCITIDGSVLEC